MTIFCDILTLHPHISKASFPTTGTFRYVESHLNMIYTSPLNTVISDAQASEIQKLQISPSPYFVKTGLFLQKSHGSEISNSIGEYFLNMQ